MPETTALVCVVSGNEYVEFSRHMFESAARHFHPTENVLHVTLDGREGWPAATMYRWHILHEHLPHAEYVYLVDADMRWEQECGDSILPPDGKGIVSTQHPGYVGRPRHELPYDSNPASSSFVESDEGTEYFAGGFVGGGWFAMEALAEDIMWLIDENDKKGIVGQWHDESALNRCLIDFPPAKILHPGYCAPEDDSYYRVSVWTQEYPRYLTALDKTPEQRVGR